MELWVADFCEKCNMAAGLIAIQTAMSMGFSKKKDYLKWGMMAVGIILIAYFMVQPWVWNGQVLDVNGVLRSMPVRSIVRILTVIQILLCFKTELWDAIYIFAIASAMQRMLFNASKILETIMKDCFSKYAESNLLMWGIYFTLLLVSCIAMTYYVTQKWHVIHIIKESRFAVVLCIIVGEINEAINLFIVTIDSNANFGATMVAMRVFNILFYIITLYLLYNLINLRMLEVENVARKAIEKQRMQQYMFSQELINSINIKSHDLKKQIRYLKKNTEVGEGLADELENILEQYDSVIHTNNVTLSTILSEKSMVCQQKGICFSCIADGRGMEFMEALDLYTLFANLMDNAIEACMELEEAKRSIEVIVKRQGDFISIHEENYCGNQLQMVDGMPLTRKNSNYHGFGLRSMKQIVEKYDGNFLLKVNKDIFQINILLPITQKNIMNKN